MTPKPKDDLDKLKEFTKKEGNCVYIKINKDRALILPKRDYKFIQQQTAQEIFKEFRIKYFNYMKRLNISNITKDNGVTELLENIIKQKYLGDKKQ